MPPPEVVRPRYLDGPEVERLTARLADRIRHRIGPDLGPYTFHAIPRGGLYVLAALAYLLDLQPGQLSDPATGGPAPLGPADDRPLVLVDDCALSGARVARVLERIERASPGRRVIVAHLLSHPALREAVVAAEPRVEACVAAADLAERDDLPSEVRAGFEPRWRERLPGRRYWLGAVAPVAFPWSEPETVWWNARDGRLEDGWRRAEPRRCLRFRAELGLPPEAAEDDPDRPAPFGLAPGVLWKLERSDDGAPERLLLRGGAEDRLYGFEGTALDVWRVLLAGGGSAEAAERLGELYQVGEAEARADVEALIEELVGRGLLAPPGS